LTNISLTGTLPPMAAGFNDVVALEIREALIQRRRSQADLAAALGWSNMYLNRRLRGSVSFSLADIEQIATALDMPRSALLNAPLPPRNAVRKVS